MNWNLHRYLLAPVFALAGFFISAQAEPTRILAGGYISPESYPGMKLAWREEFRSKNLFDSNWRLETGTGRHGWGNNELQYYRPENLALQDGYLVITATSEAYEGSQYTSSRIVSRESRQFSAGRIDIRASLPGGQGMRPVLWMEGEAGAGIDLMEMIGGSGRENTVHGTLHWRQNGKRLYEGGSVTLPNDTFTGQFHVFSIIRDGSKIQWLADNQVYFQMDVSAPEFTAFNAPFSVGINLAIGGEGPGAPDSTTQFPQRLVIDYVRVFQKTQ
jgi:beta-glucanase (GH16 family)